MIQKEYIFSMASILTIHSVCFRGATKSFQPFWEGRKLTQKCRYRWLYAFKSDKSQTANAAVVAQEPVSEGLYNIIDLCYSHIYLLGSRNARKRKLILSIGGTLTIVSETKTNLVIKQVFRRRTRKSYSNVDLTSGTNI